MQFISRSQFEDHSEEEDSEGGGRQKKRDHGYAKQVPLLFDMRDHFCSQV